MKWGVRKGIVRVNTNNKIGGQYSARKKTKIKKQAQKKLKQNIQDEDWFAKESKREYDDGLITKSDLKRYMKDSKTAKAYYSKKLKEVENDTLEAGKDYVTNTIYSLYLNAGRGGKSTYIEFRK